MPTPVYYLAVFIIVVTVIPFLAINTGYKRVKRNISCCRNN